MMVSARGSQRGAPEDDESAAHLARRGAAQTRTIWFWLSALRKIVTRNVQTCELVMGGDIGGTDDGTSLVRPGDTRGRTRGTHAVDLVDNRIPLRNGSVTVWPARR